MTEETVELAPIVVPSPKNDVTDAKWGEAEVLLALERCDRFGPPAGAFLSNVHGRVGGTRSADGVSMGIWHSRGLLIQGFEVKTSRADWLRELKKPEKADGTVFRFCDRWWLATPRSVKVVKEGELPSPWGHVTVDGCGVHIERDAPVLQPIPVDRPFIAELFRRAVEQFPAENRLRDAWNEGYAEGRTAEEKNSEQRVKFLEETNNELHSLLGSFEKVLGQRIRTWGSDERAEKVRRALAFVLDNGHENAIQRLERVRHITAELLEEIDKSLNEAKA